MKHVPLYAAIRPDGNRDDCGEAGESCYALSEWLERNHPKAQVPEKAGPHCIRKAVLGCRPPIARDAAGRRFNHFAAFQHLRNVARPQT